MIINLTAKDYIKNHEQIDLCYGEMCKILKTEDVLTGSISYTIDTDVLHGWSFLSDHSFHGTDDNVSWRRSGLGVFLLIQKTENPDGSCTLEFTDDLNPDVP